VPEQNVHNLLRQIIILSPQNKSPNLGCASFRPLQLKHRFGSGRGGVRISGLKVGTFLSLEPFVETQYLLRNIMLHLAEGNQNASPGWIRGVDPRGPESCCKFSSNNAMILLSAED
jgi:hypothetical protein